MARIRTIKPEIASDVKLAALTIPARYTFVLLISQSDDEGLIAGSHRQLLGALYPHDDAVTPAQLLAWIEELIVVGLLRWRSTVEGAPVIEITSWTKHQRIDNKGRSQLAGLLAPLAATPETVAPTPQTVVAEIRGEPPQLAVSRGLEVGSRTLEVGPRTVDRATVGNDRVDAFVLEYDFGSCAPSVAGLIRSSRNADAVIATLRMHLTGEMSHERGTPAEVGLACQQFLANGGAFNPSYFAGFVRRGKRSAEQTDNRRRNSAENRHIENEQQIRDSAAEDERRVKAFVEKFAEDNPERYEELHRRAEAAVPKKLTMGREIMVRQQLIRLIRDEAA